MTDILPHPLPWYVAGPLIGLVVPALLLLGNKPFGISANFRHACAACIPARIPFFQYEWKKESWNIFFILGITAGAFLAAQWLGRPAPLAPKDIFSFSSLLTVPGFLIMVGGGFLVGFGSRYAGGCTSGHAIMGLATLQGPS